MTEGCRRDIPFATQKSIVNLTTQSPPHKPEEDGQTFPDQVVLAIDKRVFDETYLFSHQLFPVLNVTLCPRASKVPVNGSYNVFE